VSLAIAPSTAAAPTSDGAATTSSGTAKGAESGLPFDAILDDQTDTDEAASQQICDGVMPESARPAWTAPAAPESLPVAFGTYIHGARSLLDLDADIARAVAGGTAQDHDDAAIDSLLLLLARIDLPESPELIDAPSVNKRPASSATRPPASFEAERQLWQMFVDASRGIHADERADTRLPQMADAWTRAASESAQAETLPPDVTVSRQGLPPTIMAFVDAIRLATNGGSSADLDGGSDTGSNHSPMTMGFDRSNGKAAGAIHLVQPVATFETTLGNARAASVTQAEVRLPNEANVTSSIVQTMRLQMRDGVGTAIVHLEPDYLGAVSIALRVEGGAVTATLHAENPQVRAWMEANEPLLRQGLSDQGLSLDRLLISDERVSEERSSDRRRQQEQEPPARQKSRRAEAGTFEVVV
jgi:hypothetical protein